MFLLLNFIGLSFKEFREGRDLILLIFRWVKGTCIASRMNLTHTNYIRVHLKTMKRATECQCWVVSSRSRWRRQRPAINNAGIENNYETTKVIWVVLISRVCPRNVQYIRGSEWSLNLPKLGSRTAKSSGKPQFLPSYIPPKYIMYCVVGARIGIMLFFSL